ncbi:hypothetical protein PtA15_4A883 [Puccinia triticina]|uniref:hAT-like transposase RNase-H fold domain-containing protein n=1 Tax=Puccinia triticina TaxID=208348 RepID=A0ABY7CH51_9BASI|nr:uncharacterized protein PtA15_4A883 [Puccinia triticina]WAQ84430.1 hypothetical protein PtA15_4A883 [Puccinia triticina]WAR55262.1 hypothetical protein PtB15_4B882 [Puccinia triticina]
MAKQVASNFLEVNYTQWDMESNHHRCICHVIALIKGAGLKALKLSKKILRPKKVDPYLPTLATITKEETVANSDDIVKVINNNESDHNEVNPDDALPDNIEDGWEANNEDNSTEECGTGIGLTLKKAPQRMLRPKVLL